MDHGSWDMYVWHRLLLREASCFSARKDLSYIRIGLKVIVDFLSSCTQLLPSTVGLHQVDSVAGKHERYRVVAVTVVYDTESDIQNNHPS